MVSLTVPLNAGTVFIDLVEDGGGANVIMVTVSGSLNFTSGANSTPGFSDYIAPANGTIGFGLNTALTRSWLLGAGLVVQSATPPAASGAVFAPYGTGGFAQNVLTNVSGNPLFVFLNGFQVDRGYVSGDPLSASATLAGDFQSNGITAGTATTQFTLDGLPNTLTVRSVAVPEPTAPSLAGLALLCLVGRRRR